MQIIVQYLKLERWLAKSLAKNIPLGESSLNCYNSISIEF